MDSVAKPPFVTAAAAPQEPSSGSAGQGAAQAAAAVRPPESGGPEGPEPTRYGDWERKGRCIDF